jgi:hypothetical protein
LIRPVLRHPIALLACFALAFVVWLWRDSVSDSRHPGAENQAEGPRGATLPFPVKPPPPTIPGKKWRLPVQDNTSTDLLAKLKPGMTRAEVDSLVGIPAPQDVYPVTVADGKVTYQTAYDADLGAVPSIRPVQPPTKRNPKGRTLVTLEFDATKPGHPLLSVSYPQPQAGD